MFSSLNIPTPFKTNQKDHYHLLPVPKFSLQLAIELSDDWQKISQFERIQQAHFSITSVRVKLANWQYN